MSEPHSIHCRGYCGVGKPWDDDACDCGATVRNLRTELTAARARLDRAEAVCRGVESFYCYGQNPQMDDAYRLAMIVNKAARAAGGGDDNERTV